MSIPSVAIVLALVAAEPRAGAPPEASPSPAPVRRAIERSVSFLEEGGLAWWEEHKCASCHAVPMALWSLQEARQGRGFEVDREALDDLRARALGHYADHPQLKPVGQDGKADSLSLATVYLTIAEAAAPEAAAASSKALERFEAHLLATQQADGSWTANGNAAEASQSPVVDANDVTTMWALLALESRCGSGGDAEARVRGRDRALAWLKEAKSGGGNQSLALRVLVAHRFGKEGDDRPLVEQLLNRQNADGGWSQVEGRPSDALATGQALYALGTSGLAGCDPAIGRRDYLLKTQCEDGSWPVRTRVAKGHDVIISYHGSGWATLGLLRTLADVEPSADPEPPDPAAGPGS